MTNARTYADNVVAYAQAGWPCILPVPPGTKHPPPVGFTGADGRDSDALQLVQWAGDEKLAAYAIALRMPDGVIGIDVDQYIKGDKQKRGAETLAEAVARWGPLPATWSSTARGPGQPSRILFYRVPAQRYATKLGPDVEVIQRHHRYAVVAPSEHKDAGAEYAWYGPDGAPCGVPAPDDFPELPPAWVNGLAEGASNASAAAADPASGQVLLDQLLDDDRPECADITSARLLAFSELGKADAGSRHDTMVPRVHHLVQMAAHGHTGVGPVLRELRELWASLTAGEDRGEDFERMLLTSARKAVTVVGSHQVPRDPCLLTVGGFVLPPVAAGDPSADADPDLQIVEPPRWLSVREVIGTGAFDPRAGLDQTLAEAVLVRTYPVLRFAYDSEGWLLRAPERWELHSKYLSRWAVAQMASLMPLGDPTADKESEDYARHQRRSRLMSTAGARAVAGKMDDLVAGGMHPAAVALAKLDSEPELLWAGGTPWNLRGSLERPQIAELDPMTPHLHSAAVAPEPGPTPLWDEFLAAVWPDPAVRAWAVRVLAICLTGYADRALPILIGDQGRGKTQVINLLMSVLGSYAHAADPRLLGAEGAKSHQSIVFALKGRRLSFIDEGPREGKFAAERLKQLTGGGALTANQMNQNPVTFDPTHTLVLTTNDEPTLTDPAVRARVRLIPCEGDPDKVRSARQAIGHVSGPRWRAEAPAVLAKMMAEAAAWLAEPTTATVLAAPAGVAFLAEELGAEQDPIRGWLDDECDPWEPGTSAGELYQAFRLWCQRSGVRDVPSSTKWGRVLTRLGFPPLRDKAGKRRQLRLRPAGWVPPVSESGLDQVTSWAPGDQLVTSSDPNWSPTFPQVNQPLSVAGDQLTSSLGIEPQQSEEGGVSDYCERVPLDPQLVTSSTETGRVTCENTKNATGHPTGHPPKKPRKAPDPAKTEAARAKRAAESEARRLAAVAEAGGPTIPLPALVTTTRTVPVSLEQAEQLVSLDDLTVDVEHTGYPIGHEAYALRTVQLGNDQLAVVFDAANPEHAATVSRRIAAARVLRAFSASADLVPLAYAGLADIDELWARMHDTVIPAKLADPASTGSDADGLKDLARQVLLGLAQSPDAEKARSELFKAGKWLTKVPVTTDPARSGWAQVDPTCETMVRYAASDVLDCAALAKALPPVEPDLLHRENTAALMTARVAYRGLRIDGEHTAVKLAEAQGALADAAGRLAAFGVDNPGSDLQIAAKAAELGADLPRTEKTRRLSVAKGAVDKYAAAEGPLGDFIRARLDYQKAENALGLFLEPYRLLVEHGDGRARPTVYTMEAKTGRMSCVRPNLQQVPREGGFRACITADPGHLLISADFAQVELRVAAALSQDRNLMAILDDPERDIHREIAQIVWGPTAGKAERYQAKRKVFGRLYGSGIKGLVTADPPVSEATARAIVDAMDQMTPGLSAWSRSLADGVEVGRTMFGTHSGRVVHLPTDRAYAAPNYAIQGTARELLIDALMRWRQTRWGNATLLPVHDELVVMVPEDEAEQATEELTRCMATELYGVPIVAEASAPSFAWQDSA